MNNGIPKSTVFLGNSFDEISKLPDGSLDAVITDPPYFLDGMGDSWDESTIGRKQTSGGVVASLRAGMKFDKKQGAEFQKYMEELAVLCLPKLKPGGWFAAFSAPRLYHRLAVGVEDAGYEIRDMWQWLYTQNQMKAMGLLRGLKKIEAELSPAELDKIRDELEIWKTPQVKSCFEPVVLAQKPREGTFLNNWKKHHIGLINVKSGVGVAGDMSTSNVISTESISEIIDSTFLVGKPTKTEKGEDTKHLSVKPLALMRHMVKVLVPEGGLVVDPFNGSGTTGIASLLESRNFIGFEKAEEYFIQSMKRNEAHFQVQLDKANQSFISYLIDSEDS